MLQKKKLDPGPSPSGHSSRATTRIHHRPGSEIRARKSFAYDLRAESKLLQSAKAVRTCPTSHHSQPVPEGGGEISVRLRRWGLRSFRRDIFFRRTLSMKLRKYRDQSPFRPWQAPPRDPDPQQIVRAFARTDASPNAAWDRSNTPHNLREKDAWHHHPNSDPKGHPRRSGKDKGTAHQHLGHTPGPTPISVGEGRRASSAW